MPTAASPIKPEVSSVSRLSNRSDLIFAAILLSILAILVLPIPGPVLSILLACNLSLAIMVILVAIYTKEALDFSTFPSLLLVTTLFRLSLNVASTRLILLTGTGGSVIETFGEFVVGGDIIVGLVIFLILIIIQMVVITKGAGRISEVAARFTLDAMPGKQMAIDADLNSGLISEKDARERREKISAEAEFYGSMDGASKFVKGDAIAGLIITGINLIAGIIIGMTSLGLDFSSAAERFSVLTVGDGLVSQIPSLLIAIGSGMLVTKASSDKSVGQELSREFLLKPKAIAIAAFMVLLLGLIPGMPFIPFAIISGALFYTYRTVRGNEEEEAQLQADVEQEEEGKNAEENIEDLIVTDRISIEIGYRLIPLVDKERDGTLLDRITSLRKQLARERGLLIPPIRLKDNIQIPPNAYRIMVYGNEVASGELMPDRLLAINGGASATALQGIETKEPAFGLDAIWVEHNRRGEAEGLGYAVTDPASVFITHLTQILNQHASDILNREDIQKMVDSLKRDVPALIKEVEENVKLGHIQKVIACLLDEQVPLNNFEKILECICDDTNADAQQIVENIRVHLGPSIVRNYTTDGILYSIIFDPATEQRFAQSIINAQHGSGLGIAPLEASSLVDSIKEFIQEANAKGCEATLLCTAPIRRHMRQIINRFIPELPVLSYSELGSGIQVEVLGTINLNGAPSPEAQSAI
ncbi:MAG: flagellar biosynthesis protein FlhA [Planctomycetes bacterium]|nr:flagellar biosynthesis protein FlhA [Planctomycetota bacterium]